MCVFNCSLCLTFFGRMQKRGPFRMRQTKMNYACMHAIDIMRVYCICIQSAWDSRKSTWMNGNAQMGTACVKCCWSKEASYMTNVPRYFNIQFSSMYAAEYIGCSVIRTQRFTLDHGIRFQGNPLGPTLVNLVIFHEAVVSFRVFDLHEFSNATNNISNYSGSKKT